MHRSFLIKNLRAVSPLILALLLGTVTVAWGQESDSAKVARVLNESASNLTKTAESAWKVEFEGKSLKDIYVGVGVGEGLAVVYTRFMQTKDVKFSQEVMVNLLKLNFTFDRVKIGIDPENVVFVRTDVSVRTLDKQEMSALLEQVAAAADETYKLLSPHLQKPSK